MRVDCMHHTAEPSARKGAHASKRRHDCTVQPWGPATPRIQQLLAVQPSAGAEHALLTGILDASGTVRRPNNFYLFPVAPFSILFEERQCPNAPKK